MNVLPVSFVQGTAFDSHIIEWDTRCKFSHVELLYGGETFGAQLRGGVARRTLADKCYRDVVLRETWTVPISDAQDLVRQAFVLDNLGKPYDWRAIASFGLGERDWRENDSWFCSEFCMRICELTRLVTLPECIPMWRITPRDFYLLFTMLPGAIETGGDKNGLQACSSGVAGRLTASERERLPLPRMSGSRHC